MTNDQFSLPVRAHQNPFAVHHVLKVRYEFQHGSWDDFLDRLEELDFRAAIVGPEGSGKTTLLEDLGDHLLDRGFRPQMLRLTREQQTFPASFIGRFAAQLGDRDVILFDGAEQMSRFSWLRFKYATRRAGGLVITTHRPRYLPTLVECSTSPLLLDEIVRRLIGTDFDVPHTELPALYRKHHGNLRDCLRELYDRFAGRTPARGA